MPISGIKRPEASLMNSRDVLEQGNHYKVEEGDDVTLDETNGHWFDFNDSSVSPILSGNIFFASTGTHVLTEEIASQYGGKSECAYMIIYRRKQLAEKLSELNLDIPAEIQVKVSEKDKEAEAKRKEWREAFFKLSLSVFSDKHYIREDTKRLIEKSDDRHQNSGNSGAGSNVISDVGYDMFANEYDGFFLFFFLTRDLVMKLRWMALLISLMDLQLLQMITMKV